MGGHLLKIFAKQTNKPEVPGTRNYGWRHIIDCLSLEQKLEKILWEIRTFKSTNIYGGSLERPMYVQGKTHD